MGLEDWGAASSMHIEPMPERYDDSVRSGNVNSTVWLDFATLCGINVTTQYDSS